MFVMELIIFQVFLVVSCWCVWWIMLWWCSKGVLFASQVVLFSWCLLLWCHNNACISQWMFCFDDAARALMIELSNCTCAWFPQTILRRRKRARSFSVLLISIVPCVIICLIPQQLVSSTLPLQSWLHHCLWPLVFTIQMTLLFPSWNFLFICCHMWMCQCDNLEMLVSNGCSAPNADDNHVDNVWCLSRWWQWRTVFFPTIAWLMRWILFYRTVLFHGTAVPDTLLTAVDGTVHGVQALITCIAHWLAFVHRESVMLMTSKICISTTESVGPSCPSLWIFFHGVSTTIIGSIIINNHNHYYF